MLRTLSLGTLMFAFLSLSVCWAQNKADEPPPFPFTKPIFRWDYTCPTGVNCTFACPGQATAADHLSKSRLYLGTISIDGGQTVPANFYDFATREFPHASGFSIGSGLSILSCRALGLALDYSGPCEIGMPLVRRAKARRCAGGPVSHRSQTSFAGADCG